MSKTIYMVHTIEPKFYSSANKAAAALWEQEKSYGIVAEQSGAKAQYIVEAVALLGQGKVAPTPSDWLMGTQGKAITAHELN